MSDNYVSKQRDTKNALKATLTAPDGTPRDLTDATVVFVARVRHSPAPVISRQATITDATAGKVRFAFMAGDDLSAGEMLAEFQVTYTDGAKETFPNSGYIQIKIFGNL